MLRRPSLRRVLHDLLRVCSCVRVCVCVCERAVSTGRLSLLEGEQLKFVAYRGEAFKHNAEFLEPLITQDSDDGPMGTAFSTFWGARQAEGWQTNAFDNALRLHWKTTHGQWLKTFSCSLRRRGRWHYRGRGPRQRQGRECARADR